MKTILLGSVVVSIGVCAGLAFYMSRSEISPSEEDSSVESQVTETETAKPAPNSPATGSQEFRSPAGRRRFGQFSPATSDDSAFSQALQTLVSAQAGFEERQAAWHEFSDTNSLDIAIAELEQWAGSNPHVAEYQAALGLAYMRKCGMIQDMREQGILAMKADRVFESALNLDPSNWDARFTKAVAMSYWPTQMNKGTEVMQHFVTLVEQQEAQPPKPHFAETYVWLGQEYQKYGYAEEAEEIWQRGAALFPQNQELRDRLLARP